MLEYAILPVTPFEQNCSLLWDPATRQAAVVDPGGDVDAILTAIGQFDLKVEKILLTHGHIDHVGGNYAFDKVYAPLRTLPETLMMTSPFTGRSNTINVSPLKGFG